MIDRKVLQTEASRVLFKGPWDPGGGEGVQPSQQLKSSQQLWPPGVPGQIKFFPAPAEGRKKFWVLQNVIFEWFLRGFGGEIVGKNFKSGGPQHSGPKMGKNDILKNSAYWLLGFQRKFA